MKPFLRDAVGSDDDAIGLWQSSCSVGHTRAMRSIVRREWDQSDMTGHNDRPVLVYGTAPDSGTAEYIAGELLDRRLIAMANVLPGMTTLSLWRGKRQKDTEVLMIFSTRASLADAAVAEAKVHHPIDMPMFVVVDTTGGFGPFLDWIFDQTEATRA